MASSLTRTTGTWICLLLVGLAGGACSSDDPAGNNGGSAGAATPGGGQGGTSGSTAQGGTSGATAQGGSAGTRAGSSGQAGSGGADDPVDARAPNADAPGTPDDRTAPGAPDASDARANGGDASAPSDARADALPNLATDASVRDAGGDTGAGDAGQRAYNPCPPAGTVCKIMPLGDSITQDVSTAALGGYRIPLLRRARAAAQTITFVGSNATGPTMLDGLPFPRDNEGHSGWFIDGTLTNSLYPNIVGWMRADSPHIITMMIGTNDVDHSVDLPNAPVRLGLLIDRIVETDPNVLLVVAQIIPSQDDTLNARIQTFNAAIPPLVQSRAAAGKHVLLVDMYTAFTANANFKTVYFPAGNRLHPSEAGYVVMSDIWYAAIGQLLR